MEPELTKLLALVGRREYDGDGIGLARSYVNAVGPCLAEGACHTSFFGLGTSGQWSDCIKAAGSRLVYRDPDGMTWDGGATTLEAAAGQARAFGKRFDGAEALGERSIMDLDCYVTSSRKDRDADVLDVTGAVPDPEAPLLWQHLPLAPIGRVRRFHPVQGGRLPATASIADTQLGRDAAVLVEAKCLRISIGFLPLIFEPLKGDKARDADDPRLGWWVKRYKLLEVSLVSIPSNEDAIITAANRQKLTHPLMKSWAESLYRVLPRAVNVGWDRAGAGPAPADPGGLHVKLFIGRPGEAAKHAGCSCGGTCGRCGDKATTDAQRAPEGFGGMAEFLAATEAA